MRWSRSKRRTVDENVDVAMGEESPGPRTSFDPKIRAWWRQPSGIRLLQGLVIAATVFALILAIRPPGSSFVQLIPEGEVSNFLITADFDFEYVDPVKTEEARAAVAAEVPPYFQENAQAIDSAQTQFNCLRERLPNTAIVADIATAMNECGISLNNQPIEFPKSIADQTNIPDTLFECLMVYGKEETLWEELSAILQEIREHGLVDNLSLIEEFQENFQKIREQPTLVLGYNRVDAEGQITNYINISDLLDMNLLAALAEKRLTSRFTGRTALENQALRTLGEKLIEAVVTEPTLVYLEKKTEEEREKRRNEIPEVKGLVERTHTIVGKGEVVDRETALKLKAYQERSKLSWGAEIGFFILVLIPLLGLSGYIRRYHPSVFGAPRQLAVLFLLLVFMVAIGRVVSYISRLNPTDLEQLGLAVPIAAMGLVVTILVSGRLAVVVVATASLYLGIMFSHGSGFLAMDTTVVSFWTGVAAILTVPRVKKRSDFYRAGIVVTLIVALFVLAFRLTQVNFQFEQVVYWRQLRWGMYWAVMNGVFSSILAGALLPILEDLLGVISDIKLLELSRKTPLLQRLEREAPGSYQHTMAVATLAESAAEAIQADSLLTRVGTYYHDIGKMLKPEYFVENQQSAADRARHAKLKPQMSVLVIRNHVKHGLELAREYSLPKVIADFIPEHHGTMLLKYFYHQILKEEPEEQVREEDFRYPGPKPQRKETAIVMLADAMEAAARVLPDKTEGGIRQFVRGIIRDRLEDGQFDECDLTLSELRILEDAFCDSLHHMMHQRITYPSRPVQIKTSQNDDADGNGNGGKKSPAKVSRVSEEVESERSKS